MKQAKIEIYGQEKKQLFRIKFKKNTKELARQSLGLEVY